MTEAVLKLAPDRLRVAIVAADPRRRLALSRLMRDLGHEVAHGIDGATVVLSDGVRVEGDVPVVRLGGEGESVRAQLPRDAAAGQIDAALRAVAVGLSVTVAEARPAEARGQGFAALTERDEPALLTPRETEVLRDVADGLTNKEIATHLQISQHTVKFHLESLMRKLGVSSRAEAVSKSMRLKLLEPYRL
jgi:DNA-binding CsgD family transcriptional regulator